MSDARIVIAAPRSPEDQAAIEALLVEYAETLGFSLAYQGFEDELAGLPGKYAPPTGALLLARVGGAAAGSVALRRLEPGICEMKRLYVRPAFRGARIDGVSIGRALAEGIVAKARGLGYERMRLDTVAETMGAAVRLYRSMGFVEIGGYYESPVAGTVYMELVL